VSALIDIVERHLRAGPAGVDLADGVWAELSVTLSTMPGEEAAVALLDIAAALAPAAPAPPASHKLVGAVLAVLQAIDSRPDATQAEALRRRAATVIGATTTTMTAPQPAPAGALRVGPAAFAALRSDERER